MFQAPETRWVSGAQRFDLGDLAVDAEVSMDVLMTIATEFETLASMDDAQFQSVSITGEDMLLRDRGFPEQLSNGAPAAELERIILYRSRSTAVADPAERERL